VDGVWIVLDNQDAGVGHGALVIRVEAIVSTS